MKRAKHFWDCRCEEGYLHRDTVNDCPRCGVVQSDAKNSSVKEVSLVLGIPIEDIEVKQ